MPDPRVTKLAQVLVQYSIGINPGDKFRIRTSPLAEELTLAVYAEAVKAGAHIMVQNSVPGAAEIFYKYASETQLEFVSPITKLITETFDADLYIDAEHNTRELAAIDPEKKSKFSKAHADITKTYFERAAKKDIKWSLTVYPTHAMAQEADLSLSDYQDFVYSAGLLNEPDPVAAWKKIETEQDRYIQWLTDRDQVVIKGENVDLKFSIQGRGFENCAGTHNFPDGEIFTGPVEATVNGYIRYSYPAIYGGQEVEDIELWFENGKVVKEAASKGQDLLTKMLDSDAGARFLGEWGIGTNYGIQRFTKNMLFDEKMGGTIHLAVGAGYPETGSKNESGIHWDMLCDMQDSEIVVDGEVFYKDGKFVI
jgi:aminopeptidase